MNILINLLPDVRQAKLRERRRRQMASGISVMVWVVCGAVVALMAVYVAGQKVVIANYTNSINSNKAKLQAVSGLVDALTAEQHLASLPSLYEKRIYMTKFFEAYTSASPGDVSLTSMTIDSQNALVVNGVGATYASVAKLARALEAANVSVGTTAAANNTPYFSGVTITNVSSTTAHGVSFTIGATLDTGVTSNGTR
jgi:Tfp pilus assembly protein PilN